MKIQDFNTAKTTFNSGIDNELIEKTLKSKKISVSISDVSEIGNINEWGKKDIEPRKPKGLTH